jgi:hydrogenase maturation protease
MPRILVIGYGNLLRGDDGLGRHAARQLAEMVGDPDVEIMARHQLVPEMADSISRAELVIFIDARHGGKPGEISFSTVAPNTSHRPFMHHVTPAELLAAAETLYGRHPEAILFSVSAKYLGIGELLSRPLLSTLPRLLQAIACQIAISLERDRKDAATHLTGPHRGSRKGVLAGCG